MTLSRPPLRHARAAGVCKSNARSSQPLRAFPSAGKLGQKYQRPIPCHIDQRCLRRNAEMEREIADLRRRLASGEHAPTTEANASDDLSQCSEDVFCRPDSAGASGRSRPMSAPLGPQPLATPMNAHRDGSILSQDDNLWRLEDVSLSKARVARLFDQ